MAKIQCKGTVLKQTIANSLTAIAQIIGFDLSGSKSDTYESTTLDITGPWKTFDLTGYSTPGKLSGELFYDVGLAGHKAITTLMGHTTGPTAPAQNAMQITYADGGSTTQSFTAASVGFDATVAMDSGLKGKFNIEITGDPGFPT